MLEQPQVSGWLNDSVLAERVNRVKRRRTRGVQGKDQGILKLTANRIVLKKKKEEVDKKEEIRLLKKEC